MSRVIQDLTGNSPKKGRGSKVSYPYKLTAVNGNQWEVTNVNHDPVVYIVWAENGLFKIGYTKSVVSRIYALDAASPIPIRLFHLITTNNTYELEKQLHEKLFPFWVRGEWFLLPEETADWLVSITDMQYEQSRVPYVDEYDSYYRYGTVRGLP